MNNQKGFTLIELVVVIVILGILAAVAVPKFVDMQSDARQSALEGLYGSVSSAISLAHAQGLVKGQTGPTGAVDMEGDTIDLVYGYPAVGTTGTNGTSIEDTVNLSADFTYSGGTFTLVGGTNCTLTYTEATSSEAANVSMSATCQ